MQDIGADVLQIHYSTVTPSHFVELGGNRKVLMKLIDRRISDEDVDGFQVMIRSVHILITL